MPTRLPALAGAPTLKLLFDEPAQTGCIEWCQLAKFGAASLQQESPQNAQALGTRVLGKASGGLHVLIEAVELLFDCVRDGTLDVDPRVTQQCQEVP